jgi:glycosyltransferase involved in cell wall biosynthesis
MLRLLPGGPTADAPEVLSWELPAALDGADLVHLHGAATRAGEVSLLAAKQQRKPVCVSEHDGPGEQGGVFRNRLDLADRIVCSSEYARKRLQTRTAVEILKGVVDGEYFTPPEWPGRRDRVLYAGRLVPSMGIDRLINAMPPGLPLVVCGRPEHPDYYRLLRRLAARKPVEFLPDADDATVRDLHRRAWANVLPACYENCYGQLHPAPDTPGLTLLEAMACGTPVVCSRVGGMPELVRHGETGFVFDTPDELTGRLRQLADSPALVEQMGRQAREAVEREWDYRAVGAQLLSVYEALLAPAGGAAA